MENSAAQNSDGKTKGWPRVVVVGSGFAGFTCIRELEKRLAEIDHSLGVLWDLRRRELAGEHVGLEEDVLDHYFVSPGDNAPDDYIWAR